MQPSRSNLLFSPPLLTAVNALAFRSFQSTVEMFQRTVVAVALCAALGVADIDCKHHFSFHLKLRRSLWNVLMRVFVAILVGLQEYGQHRPAL